MAGERIDQIRDLPFDVASYKDYLNHSDDQLAQAANYIQQLIRSGQLTKQFRTTAKFDQAQARGEAQRAGAITQTQRLEAPDLPAGSPFGPTIEAAAAPARERIAAEREESLREKRAANARAERRGDPLPYPDVTPAAAPEVPSPSFSIPESVKQQEAAMAARGGMQVSPAAAWTNLANVFKADPMAWDAEQEILMNAQGINYALVRGGKVEVISQAQFRQDINSLSREERRSQQQFMKQFWGSRYKGPTDGSIDKTDSFRDAMEQYAAFSTRQNVYQYRNAAAANFAPQFKPFDQAALTKQSGGIGGGGATTTTRTVSIADFSDEEASAILEDFYTDALGRRPNKKEAQKFAELIRKKAAERPSVTTTTAGGGTTTIRQGAGFGQTEAQMLARETAEAQPQFRPRQMATTVFDGFMAALQGQFR